MAECVISVAMNIKKTLILGLLSLGFSSAFGQETSVYCKKGEANRVYKMNSEQGSFCYSSFLSEAPAVCFEGDVKVALKIINQKNDEGVLSSPDGFLTLQDIGIRNSNSIDYVVSETSYVTFTPGSKAYPYFDELSVINRCDQDFFN